MPETAEKHIRTTENFLVKKAYIAREEQEYLRVDQEDLLNIGYIKDSGVSQVIIMIENIFNFFLRKWRVCSPSKTQYWSYLYLYQTLSHDLTTYDNDIVISRHVNRRAARITVTALTIAILLIPIILLNVFHRTVVRFAIVFVSFTLFVVGISLASDAGMAEIFGGGAAYAVFSLFSFREADFETRN